MLKKRYPGVSPFTQEQSDIFFGRDDDIKRMYKMISMRERVLLYAKSGIGKTSLLNAGVLPLLQKRYTIVNVRFFAYHEKNPVSPLDNLLNELQQVTGHTKNNDFLDKLVAKTDYNKTLWYYFKKLQLAGKEKFIVVFDQFEELFTYPEEEISAFKEELHELANVDIPLKIKQYLVDQNDNITEDEIDELYDSPEIKTVFAIRSDRLSLLNNLTDKIPDIQDNYYELKPLNIDQAKSAIINPAGKEGEFETKPFLYSQEAIGKITQILSNNGKQNIESTQLQIVCQKIENISTKKVNESLENKPVTIDKDDLPEFKDIFLDFYEEAITSVAGKDKHKAALLRKFIEDQLIRNNQRISLDAIICEDYISREDLQRLVNTHLLRAERNSTGGFSYELSHDTLIDPVLISRKKRIEREEKERLEKQRQEELRKARERAEKEQREREIERKRQRKITLIIGTAAIIAIAFAIFGYVNMRKAQLSEQRLIKMTVNNYLKDAERYIDKEEFKEAIEKYLYLRDTMKIKNDTINKGLARAKGYLTLQNSFYNYYNTMDSLLSNSELERPDTNDLNAFIRFDTLYNAINKLGYDSQTAKSKLTILYNDYENKKRTLIVNANEKLKSIENLEFQNSKKILNTFKKKLEILKNEQNNK